MPITPATNFTTLNLSPLSLKLDIRNPRFLSMQPTQENAIFYLMTYSKVKELAKSIVSVGGMFPGERIVVYLNEQNEYIVLEGNRRVCACKLLLDPSLIPIAHRRGFSTITDDIRQAITTLNIDVIQSREDADSFLTSRHIGGVEHWDTLAKQQFFEEKFSAGKSLDEISITTNYPVTEIKKDISEYYLFQKAYSLPCWTQQQKGNELNLFAIQVDKFIRIFNTRGAKSALQLTFDVHTLKPGSGLPSNIFDSILQRIMYCAYIATQQNEKIDTRTKSWRDVPGLQAILDQATPTSTQPVSPPPAVQTPSIQTTQTTNPVTPGPGIHQTNIFSNPPANTPGVSTPPSIPSSAALTAGTTTTIGQTPSPQLTFFESLTWGGVDPGLPENQGLITIAEEIKRISIGSRPFYRQIPICATTLLRSLVEQSIKYHLRKVDRQALHNLSTRYDPSLNSLIKHYTDNQRYTHLIHDQSMQRLFSSLFGNSALKDFLDLSVHQPHFVIPSDQHLENYAQGGLCGFINYILNIP